MRKKEKPNNLWPPCPRMAEVVQAVWDVTDKSIEDIKGPTIRISELSFGNPQNLTFLYQHVLKCPNCRDMFLKGILDRYMQLRRKK